MRAWRIAVIGVLMATRSFGQDAARMEQVIQAQVATGAFMGAVLVSRGDKPILDEGYGLANLEWAVPNTPSTKFRLGSLTKQFTAASILLLEERGRLQVEDPVTKYMPDAPGAWAGITIFHLLTHSSGIPNFTSLPEFQTVKLSASPVEKVLATVRDKPLSFAPGTKQSYSNSGYLVLGHIIERLTGGSYAQFVTDNIFMPLGMKDSGYDSNTAIILQRASGYTRSAAGLANADYVHMSIPHAAGGLYSTTRDLLKWERALFDGALVSEASLQKMTTPPMNDYAFGLIVRTDNGRRLIWHNGGIEGFNTSMAYYPDTKTTIIVLANVNGSAPDQLVSQLGAIAHGDRVTLTSERRETTVPSAVLAQYPGAYELASGVTMTITLEGGQLMTQITGQGKLAMFAESDTAFFLKAADAQIEFARNPSGVVTHLVLRQNGRDLKATRR